MSEILTREKLDFMRYDAEGELRLFLDPHYDTIGRWNVDDVISHLRSLLALLDAHDAALEVLRFYADKSHMREVQAPNHPVRYEFGEWVDEDEFFTVWHPDNGDRARAALASVATPQEREVTHEDG